MKIKEDACISAQEPKPGLQHVVISVSGCVNVVVLGKFKFLKDVCQLAVNVMWLFLNSLSKYYVLMVNSASNLTSVNM